MTGYRVAPDLVGRRYGRLLVTEKAPTLARKQSRWMTLCDCGQFKIISAYSLIHGATTSCECYRREVLAAGRALLWRHGHAKGGISPTYVSWQAMLHRCYHTQHTNYRYYGAKGIRVCQRWRHSFADFLADVGERPHGTTLDRIDGTKGYKPGNVRWASAQQQADNRRNRKYRVTDIDGNPVTLAQLAHTLALPRSTAYSKLVNRC